MNTIVKQEKFSGPLDLLLQLIENQELQITEIALSEITEEYLKELEKLNEMPAEDMADFLSLASRLVYLKSKYLLPYLYEEEEEGPNLADQLKMYKKFVDASHKIEEMWLSDNKSYGRIEPPQKMKEVLLPLNAEKNDLHQTFLQVLRRLKPIDPIPKATIDRSVSISEVVSHLRHTLKQLKKFKFSDVFKSARNKTEVIISFLAVLDMLKKGEVYMTQQNAFDDFEIISR